MAPGTALAQVMCNSSLDPTPPPAVHFNVSNKTFGNRPPLKPFAQVTIGMDGCTGAAGGDEENGVDGSPGQPGGLLTSTTSNVIILGGADPGDPGFATIGAAISAIGGAGGDGGTAGRTGVDENRGGNGGAGGAGGTIMATFNGTFLPDPMSGLVADTALSLFAGGASGGAGGDSSGAGIFSENAGAGGAGGAGGSITLVASGFVQGGTGVSANVEGGGGGAGGYGLNNTDDYVPTTNGGDAGDGGAGGTASVEWSSGSIAATVTGISAASDGGFGGDGGAADFSLTTTEGGDGGMGGNGGTASVLLSQGGSVTVGQSGAASAAILVETNGGDGGGGGEPGGSDSSEGGNGGNGGAGGTASATVLGTVTYNGLTGTGQLSGQGILIQANGGRGGNGGGAESITGGAGGGGFAGAGGSATLTLGNAASIGTVRTSGNFSHGALVQSVGGGGGDGGVAHWGATGGAGAAGGDGGLVSVDAPNASVIATGTSSGALLAQSIGGGGGSGGDAIGVTVGFDVTIGGNGGLGGNGGPVTLNLGKSVFASTNTMGGAGILVQSIGGAGGAGGSATAKGFGAVTLTIGGDAGGGGTGGGVDITSESLITTYGDHAHGLEAQSIGGGGGKGGSAFAFTVGVLPTASIAVGGAGGSGGPAGDVKVDNGAQITTYGADAFGVVLQSIGGGGGSGGAAAATAVALSPDKRFPAVSIAIATGGKGGDGNTGGNADLNNTGLITTAGDAAIGVLAQSIGGGGGTGGDATAAAYSGSPEKGIAISLATAVGGSGGTGGIGGGVSIMNEGLIATLGQDAYGVFAQSVGGGGGTGGAGDASASASKAKFSFSTSLAIGGKGGKGGDAGTVGLMNSGAIVTSGDGSDAVFSQSVGGGGGVGGGGVATANGGNLSIAVGLGGNGGAGGDGNTATVENSGGIVTRGTDSIGLSVQSIGGGGGKAGKGGATAGGAAPVSNIANLFNTLNAGLNFGQTVTNLGNGILQIGLIGQDINATFNELNGILMQPQAGANEIGSSTNINVSVSVGGDGGAAGNGGAANATNTGIISTYGAQSDGIYAQSVGGGGGSAGAASSTSAAADDTPNQAAIAVGGKGGSGGKGGIVTVTNGTGAFVMTQGVAALGVFAQSVGGGGGEGSFAGTVTGSLKSLGLGIGGNGGKGGDGGAVNVTTGDGHGTSSIETTGKHGIGIFAQSVGGGGGLVRTMTTDQTFDPSKIIINPQGRLGDVHGFDLDLGGQNGVAGDGGEVSVTTMGSITTGGLDAHGILAQSIGGGGGAAVGGRVNFSADGGGGAGRGSGQGGSVTLQLQPSTIISTTGNGAYGILAQSIGGGGGIAGDLSAVHTYQWNTNNAVKSNSGDGGAISISANGATIQTSGTYAPAIFAQSIGGGGGLLSYNQASSSAVDVLAHGTAGGSGMGGTVTISLVNSHVLATGIGSAGILAQSDGTTSSAIMITLDQSSTVQGGLPDPNFPGNQIPDLRDVAGIRILGDAAGDTSASIVNAGTIRGDSTPGGGIAILSSAGFSVVNMAGGTIIGDQIFYDGSGSVVNQLGGIISAPTRLDLNGGILHNSGTLTVGGAGSIGETRLTGDLDQSATGATVIDIDPANGQSDLLQITGHAVLNGIVSINPMSFEKGTTQPVINAAGGISGVPVVQDLSTVFMQSALLTGNTLSIITDADFGSDDPGRSDTERSLAGYLQRLFDEDASGFEAGFLSLGSITSDQAYEEALDAISGQEIAAIASSRYAGSQNFARGAFSGSDNPEAVIGDTSLWERTTGFVIDHEADGGFPAYSWRAVGVDLGGQVQFNPDWLLAGSAGYEGGRLETDDNRVEADSETGQALVALRYQNGSWKVDGIVDLSYGAIDTRRTIAGVGAASASSNVFNGGFHLRTAYRLPLCNFYVEPALELDANYVRVDGYAENGAAPFNLQVNDLEDVVLAATPELRVGTPITVRGNGLGNVYAGAGVSFLSGNDFETDARFTSVAGDDGFRSTLNNDEVVGRFTAGVQFQVAKRVDLRLQYRGRASSHEIENGGEFRIGYTF